jgi:serine/threonine protein kinase
MKSCPQCSATYPDDYAVCPKDGTALQDTSPWQVNTVIRGRYKILALIGEGGMASVYKAHHQLLDELRALKVIKSELARDTLFVQRFKNEAIITRKLQHPNAVRVDDLDIAEDGRPFISMELVQGESLKPLIQRTGALGVTQTLDLALQVCQALDAAHTLGLIHRDIKPDNIYLVPRGDGPPLVKVLDFGIARLKEEAPGGAKLRGMTLTGTGVVIGTPEYMSPEQAMGKHGEQLDGRSDLYSLGVVMYRMLTGELPFKADTTVEMILHHIQTIPKPPQSRVGGRGLSIPDAVSAIVMRALEKDREKRFPSAASMAEAIRAAATLKVATPQPALAPYGAGPAVTVPLSMPLPPPPAAKAGVGNQELLPPPRESTFQTPPPPARVAAPASRPSPAKPVLAPYGAGPASVRPAASVSLQKKAFPTGAILVGIVGATVLLLGLWALKRHRATSAELAAGPRQQTLGGPSPAGSRREEPGPGRVGGGGGRGVKQMIQNAQVFFDAGDYLGAARVARRALVLDPNNDAAKQIFVRSLQKQGQQFYNAAEYRRAAMTFRRILEVDPNNTVAQESLKQCLAVLREHPE